MSSQDLYDGLWERSIQRFPQLAEQFGQAPPRDAKGRPLLDAMIALRTLRLQAPAPQQPAPTPTPAPQQLVPTQQPAGAPQQDLSGLTQPSYWDPGEWARRGRDIVTGIATLPLPISPWGMSKTVKAQQEAMEQLPPDTGLWKKALVGGLGGVEPQLKALEAAQKAMAPATGALVSTRIFKEQETLLPRYNALRDQGMDPVSAYAGAYQSAKEAGEIPWWKEMILEALTDPLELIPGGWAAAVGGRAARAGAASVRATARAAGRQVPEAAARAVPSDVGAVQRALPMMETAQGVTPSMAPGAFGVGPRVADPMTGLPPPVAGQPAFWDVPGFDIPTGQRLPDPGGFGGQPIRGPNFREFTGTPIARNVGAFISDNPGRKFWYHGGPEFDLEEGRLIEAGFITDDLTAALGYVGRDEHLYLIDDEVVQRFRKSGDLDVADVSGEGFTDLEIIGDPVPFTKSFRNTAPTTARGAGGFGGQPIPDVPAEELMRRQAAAPGEAPEVARPAQLWSGKPDETLWDPTTRQWLQGLHKWNKRTKKWVPTKAGRVVAGEAEGALGINIMDIATDTRQAAPVHPFDELIDEDAVVEWTTLPLQGPKLPEVPGAAGVGVAASPRLPSGWPSTKPYPAGIYGLRPGDNFGRLLDSLVALRQAGLDDAPGHKVFNDQLLDQAATQMFGGVDNQTRRSVGEYVRHLVGERAIEAERQAAQREMPLGLLEGPLAGATRRPLVNLEDYFRKDPLTDEWVRREDVPIPAQSSWRTHADALELEEYTNRFGARGGTPASSQASQWVQDDNFAFSQQDASSAGARALDQMLPTPDEIRHSGPGWTLDKEKYPLAKGRFQAAIRSFFGTMRNHEGRMENVILNGRRELQEMNWLDKDGFPTAEGLGTLEEPGGLRILYYTLDDKTVKNQLEGEWGKLLQALGPAAVRQFHNLRAYASWEEIHSIEAGLLNNPNPKEAYFHRGWKIPDGAWANIHGNVAQYQSSPGGALGRRSGAFQSRNDVPFEEMDRFGFEPLYWNPYETAMIRSRMGMQTRLQTQLVSMLKNPALGLARYSYDPQVLDEWSRDGWRAVTNAGPALKGDTFVGVKKKFTDAINADEHAEVIQMQWVFPKKVADTLEQMFAPRKPQWNWMRTQKRFDRLGIDVKFDDIFYIPKRANLFASLFQQVDFSFRVGIAGTGASLYRVIEGMRLMGKGSLTADPDAFHQGFRHLAEAHTHLVNMPKAWRDMARGNLSPNFREYLRKELISNTPLYDNPALAEITNANLVRHGLHVRDATIFDAEDGVTMLRQSVERGRAAGMVAAAGRGIKNAEMAMRRGMFDGMYPAAILHDVKYNLIPLIRATNPDMTPSQIMSIAAKRANKRWSTIPVEQSVVRGHMREFLQRFSFSLNENESFFRQMMGAVRGPEKAFWATHWAGAFLFMAGVANLIHFATTTLTEKDGKGRFLGVDWGSPLPWGRYVPFHLRGWYTFKYGFNPALLSPDFPIPTRAGDNSLLDLLMQFDFMFRLTDGAYGMPGLSFINARAGTTPRAIWSQVSSRDYMGRDIGEWGYLQRALQFVTDEFAPIGAGQVAIALGRTAFKDKDLPELTPFGIPIIPKEANIDRLTPSIEAKLGNRGVTFQGLGFNLKSSSNEMLRDRMVKRVFGEGNHPEYLGKILTSWQQLKKEKDAPNMIRALYRDQRNAREVREIGERQREGAEYWYDDYGQMVDKTRESSRKRLEAETTVVDRNTKTLWDPKDQTAWSPTTFRDDLKAINKQHRVRVNTIKEVYGDDNRVAAAIEQRGEPPDRAKEPLYWAIHKWAEVRKKHTDPVTNDVNFTTFDLEWDREIAQWDDEMAHESGGLAERFNKWLDQGEHHPFVDQYYDALGQIEDSGYWEDKIFEPDEMLALKQGLDPILASIGKTADGIWSEYLAAPAEERRRLQAHPNRAIQQVIKNMNLARKAHRYQVVTKNPEIDQLLIMWFANTPYIYQNGAFYQSLYGKLPGSYRQSPY